MSLVHASPLTPSFLSTKVMKIHFWGEKLKKKSQVTFNCVYHKIIKTFRAPVICCLHREVMGRYTKNILGFNLYSFCSINSRFESSVWTVVVPFNSNDNTIAFTESISICAHRTAIGNVNIHVFFYFYLKS